MARATGLLLAVLLHARLVYARELPGPAPQNRPADSFAQNQRCQHCHSEITREWQQSFHRKSYTDPAFRRALQLEPRPFCRACHAPEADPVSPAVGWAAAAGVACVTCHVLDGRITSGPARTGTARAPHAVTRDPRFAGDDACQHCHEFSFPDGHARTRPALMQSTISEHRSSFSSERDCTSCHMPRVGAGRGHRSHRFLGGHDEQLMRRTLTVTAERTSPSGLRLFLSPNQVGHALPTGDLLRRLMVAVSCAGPAGAPMSAQVRYLTRHFAMEQQLPGLRVMVTRSDDRIAAPTTLDFTLPQDPCTTPHWRVTYQRVIIPGSPLAQGSASDTAVLDGEIVLATGQLGG